MPIISVFIYTYVFIYKRKLFKFMSFFALSQKYAKYVGLRRDFRLVVRGAARNMVAILNGSGRFCSPFFKKEKKAKGIIISNLLHSFLLSLLQTRTSYHRASFMSMNLNDCHVPNFNFSMLCCTSSYMSLDLETPHLLNCDLSVFYCSSICMSLN